MKSSLVPEKPILVYPSLASTVGLDEAVMLATLSDITLHNDGTVKNGYCWYQVSVQHLEECMPFWDRRDLQRVSTSLREKGIIIIGPGSILQDEHFKFAFNEKHLQQNASAPRHTPPPPATPSAGKNFIAQQWQPTQMVLDQLAQLNVPQDFAQRQVPEFVTYWRERNEAHRSWGQKFISHTLARWRDFEQKEQRKTLASPMPSAWQPSEATMNDLSSRKIPREFILDRVHEFIHYWLSTGESHLSWDAKFIQKIQSEWARSEAQRNVSNQEYPIFSSWRPSEDAMDVMVNKSEIPQQFIEDAIAEFIIYWKERGTASNTWNSLFIKHVRIQWHRFQHAVNSNTTELSAMASNWQPTPDVYDILKLANIDAHFAQGLIPEFILYWQDRNELHRSWNTKFLQHVKRMWAARHQLPNQVTSDNRSTRDISLEEQLNDTSWAD